MVAVVGSAWAVAGHVMPMVALGDQHVGGRKPMFLHKYGINLTII